MFGGIYKNILTHYLVLRRKKKRKLSNEKLPKEFFDFYGYSSTNDVACFVCYNQATDIHHIKPRGMGGSKCKDYVENLSQLCRPCHEKSRA